jgi:hypothetical protein
MQGSSQLNMPSSIMTDLVNQKVQQALQNKPIESPSVSDVLNIQSIAEVPSSEVPSSEVPSSDMPSSDMPSSEMPSSEMPSSQLPSSQRPALTPRS